MSAYSDDVVRRMKEAASTFEERSAVYKDNVHMVGKVMEALFPDGHTQQDEQDHNRWHIFELMIVKITRYVLNYDSGGHEDSLTDLAVYATMLNALDQEAANLATPGADALSPGVAEYISRKQEYFDNLTRIPNNQRYHTTILLPNDDPHAGQDFDWPHTDTVGHHAGSMVDPSQGLWMVQNEDGKSDGQRYCWTCGRKVHEFSDPGEVFYLHDVGRTDGYGHELGQRPPTPSQVEQDERGTVKCKGCNGVLRFVNGAWRHTGYSYSG